MENAQESAENQTEEIQVEKEWVKPGELLHHSMDNIPVKFTSGYAMPVKIPSIKTTIMKQKQKSALDRNNIKQLRKHGRKNKYRTEFKSGKAPYVVPLNSQNFY